MGTDGRRLSKAEKGQEGYQSNWGHGRLSGKHPLLSGDGDIYCQYPLCKLRATAVKGKGDKRKECQVNTRAPNNLFCRTCGIGFHFECWNEWHGQK